MPVRVLFFASHRDRVGVPELSLEVPAGETVSGLVARVRGKGPPFDALPELPAVAVNRAYAAQDAPVADGDEVAFIPPVAGG